MPFSTTEETTNGQQPTSFVLLFLAGVFLAALAMVLVLPAAAQDEDPAVEAVRAHPQVVRFLRDKTGERYQVRYESLSLGGGGCGVAGCAWTSLVSLTVTRLVSDAPSTAILAVVSGMSPAVTEPTVTFVDLEWRPVNPELWTCPLGHYKGGACVR